MLSDTLFRVPREPGLHVLQRRGEHGARELTSSRLCLRGGAAAPSTFRRRRNHCRAAAGRRQVRDAGREPGPSRATSVFDRARHCLVPATGRAADGHGRIDARGRAGLGAVVRGGDVALVGPDDVTVNARGRGTYAREVHDLFVRDPYAKRLMVGETFNPPGHWSSYPAAQARRAQRRAVSRRGLSLQGQPRARVRPPDALHRGWRIGDASGARR